MITGYLSLLQLTPSPGAVLPSAEAMELGWIVFAGVGLLNGYLLYYAWDLRGQWAREVARARRVHTARAGVLGHQPAAKR